MYDLFASILPLMRDSSDLPAASTLLSESPATEAPAPLLSCFFVVICDVLWVTNLTRGATLRVLLLLLFSQKRAARVMLSPPLLFRLPLYL